MKDGEQRLESLQDLSSIGEIAAALRSSRAQELLALFEPELDKRVANKEFLDYQDKLFVDALILAIWTSVKDWLENPDPQLRQKMEKSSAVKNLVGFLVTSHESSPVSLVRWQKLQRLLLITLYGVSEFQAVKTFGVRTRIDD